MPRLQTSLSTLHIATRYIVYFDFPRRWIHWNNVCRRRSMRVLLEFWWRLFGFWWRLWSRLFLWAIVFSTSVSHNSDEDSLFGLFEGGIMNSCWTLILDGTKEKCEKVSFSESKSHFSMMSEVAEVRHSPRSSKHDSMSSMTCHLLVGDRGDDDWYHKSELEQTASRKSEGLNGHLVGLWTLGG